MNYLVTILSYAKMAAGNARDAPMKNKEPGDRIISAST
jgi:hypothetical protein